MLFIDKQFVHSHATTFSRIRPELLDSNYKDKGREEKRESMRQYCPLDGTILTNLGAVKLYAAENLL